MVVEVNFLILMLEKNIIPYILDRGFTKLDYIIISHFDSDHCGGFAICCK